MPSLIMRMTALLRLLQWMRLSRWMSRWLSGEWMRGGEKTIGSGSSGAKVVVVALLLSAWSLVFFLR